MKLAVRSLAVAFAIANLYLLSITGPLISPDHQLVFHMPGPATPLFGAAVADLLALTVIFAAVLLLVARRPRPSLIAWAALLLPLPWVLVNTVADFQGRPPAAWVLWPTGLTALAVWGFVIARRRALLPLFRRLQPALTTLLSFVALSGLVILGHLVWLGWKARGAETVFTPRAASSLTARAATSPHLVWIILDELSYRQVYGHRFPGLTLPNFDRLASESTLFPNAVAAAQYTRIAVPSLLTGERLSATNPAADNRHLLLHRQGGKGWQPLDPENTVFGDAARDGLRTGIAGWYEPYCRVLPGVLDRCFWTYSDNIPGGYSARRSVTENALQPPLGVLLKLGHLIGLYPGYPSAGLRDVQQHSADFRALVAAGDQLLLQQTSGLTLLHMPVPHPWGFYDRRTGRFPGHRTSYLDNLALADMYLGHVRSLLEAQGRWDSADVIIMGDHGWRTQKVWSRSGFWLPEEQAASKGAATIDPPAVIVKLHGQHTPAVSPSRFDAVETRSLIDALLHGSLTEPAQLERWTAEQVRR